MAQRPVALVTGSGKRRVGNVVARWLGKAGFDVVVHYRTSKTEAKETALELEQLGVRSEALYADLTIEGEVNAMFDQVDEAFGRLDALVCAASTWGTRQLEETDATTFRREWENNTLSTFLCCRQAGMRMVSQPMGGSIVTISDWAIARPYLDHTAYFAAKGSLPTLTRTLAVELAQRNPNVRVNCILPGPVMLPSELPAVERQAAIDATLVKREGTPEHVAQAVVFLIRNDFITGVCLPVDGGRSIYA